MIDTFIALFIDKLQFNFRYDKHGNTYYHVKYYYELSKRYYIKQLFKDREIDFKQNCRLSF